MKSTRNAFLTKMRQVLREHHVMNYSQLMRRVYRDPDVHSFLVWHRGQISAFELNRSASRLYEFVNEKRKHRSGHGGAVAGYLPKLVLDDHTIGIAYQPTQQTIEKQKDAVLRSRFRSVSMSKKVKRARLDDFDFSEDQTRGRIVNRAVQFAVAYRQHPSQYHKGMYIYGKFGVGKTYLLAALANRLAKLGIQTTLVHFPTFADEMKASIHDHSAYQKINTIKRAQVLMLDDIGAGDGTGMSDWIRDDVFSVILEYRMQNEMSTFFSSNLSMKQFANQCLAMDKQGNQIPLTAQRIMERIHFLADEYNMKGRNRRNPGLN